MVDDLSVGTGEKTDYEADEGVYPVSISRSREKTVSSDLGESLKT